VGSAIVDKGTDYYMLVCVDGFDGDGTAVSAFDLAKFRLQALQWPLYENTGRINQLGKSDYCLVYVGGASGYGQAIIGETVIRDVVSELGGGYPQETLTELDPASKYVIFADVRI